MNRDGQISRDEFVGLSKPQLLVMFGSNNDEGQFGHESNNGLMIMILPILKRGIAYR
jgi:hypothetical protein